MLHASGNDCQKNVGVGYSGSTRNERNKELAAAARIIIEIEERVLRRDREAVAVKRARGVWVDVCTLPQASSLRQEGRDR